MCCMEAPLAHVTEAGDCGSHTRWLFCSGCMGLTHTHTVQHTHVRAVVKVIRRGGLINVDHCKKDCLWTIEQTSKSQIQSMCV